MIIHEENTRTTSTSAGEAGVALTATPLIRIWLVDDDDRLRSIMAEWLKRFEGIECTGDFNSPNAVLSALASKQGPDVILLDVQMGEHSGLDAVRPIRSLSRSTRVVMFTSSFDVERRKRALDDGASDFLLKFNPLEEVVERICALAREPAPVMRRRPQTAECGSSAGGQRKRGWFGARSADSVPDPQDVPSPRGKRLLNRYFDMFMGVRD